MISVAIGGFCGAICRFMVSKYWTKGTFIVNIIGAFILGVVISYQALVPLVVTGFCGSFTTFSTFSFEVITLWQDNKQQAVTYALCTTGFSLLAVFLGMTITSIV
ncbi:putative fluoride ion transporter CrcB 2 [Lysinibacillus alkalisoli]|uniref:Fluoride-specific ion channel FluC n=1 Tax=Lysinibacillus alkalisoli TaxID=1911548 RepID=A0A917FZF1_9BACI|nr:CrcB family protein [Lysinibacillus alkalisoli]GGG15183.1 putative fluoride ion transporter CrcB 2 [Lysinibacillus alkalisoli]